MGSQRENIWCEYELQLQHHSKNSFSQRVRLVLWAQGFPALSLNYATEMLIYKWL